MQKISSNSVSKSTILSSSSPRCVSPENGFLLNTRRCTIHDNNAHQKFQLEYPDICASDEDFLESVETHSEIYLPPTAPLVSEEEYDEIPIDCFENRSNSSGSFTSRIRQTNAIFLQRLQDIANNKNDNRDRKLITYRKWLGTLLRLNELFVNKIEDLKSEMAEQLEYFRRANADRCRSQSNELRKYHRDIDSSIKIIRNAFHNGAWDFQSLFLKTISRSQVFGVSEPNAVQLHCNLKVLAAKLAEKHDEILSVRKHIASMEGQMRYVQKSLCLKKELIEKLRKSL
uniref:Uncharacterized protein n=1 Tax=Glossina pallidipes TaxID=7398 RepID=A0A1B0AHU3_GLOPL